MVIFYCFFLIFVPFCCCFIVSFFFSSAFSPSFLVFLQLLWLFFFGAFKNLVAERVLLAEIKYSTANSTISAAIWLRWMEWNVRFYYYKIFHALWWNVFNYLFFLWDARVLKCQVQLLVSKCVLHCVVGDLIWRCLCNTNKCNAAFVGLLLYGTNEHLLAYIIINKRAS